MSEERWSKEKIIDGLKRIVDDDKMWRKADYYAMTCKEALEVIGAKPTVSVIDSTPTVWTYYTNDEGKARWKCSACGKICKRRPTDKRYCSQCGKPMRMEG